MKNIIFFLLLFAIQSTCHAQTEIEDGFYLVKGSSATLPETVPAGSAIISYSPDFIDESEEEPIRFVIADPSEFVPLRLRQPPDSVAQADKRINLMLTLSEGPAAQLADFTGKHLGQAVAIVIGGKVVTMHKIRARIEGGMMQISRCTDNACERLFFELRDNVDR